MNIELLADALGYLDDELLEEHFTEKARLSVKKPKRRPSRLRQWLPRIAACFLTAAIIIPTVLYLNDMFPSDGTRAPTTDGPVAGAPSGEPVPPSGEPAPPSDSPSFDNSSYSTLWFDPWGYKNGSATLSHKYLSGFKAVTDRTGDDVVLENLETNSAGPRNIRLLYDKNTPKVYQGLYLDITLNGELFHLDIVRPTHTYTPSFGGETQSIQIDMVDVEYRIVTSASSETPLYIAAFTIDDMLYLVSGSTFATEEEFISTLRLMIAGE